MIYDRTVSDSSWLPAAPVPAATAALCRGFNPESRTFSTDAACGDAAGFRF